MTRSESRSSRSLALLFGSMLVTFACGDEATPAQDPSFEPWDRDGGRTVLPDAEALDGAVVLSDGAVVAQDGAGTPPGTDAGAGVDAATLPDAAPPPGAIGPELFGIQSMGTIADHAGMKSSATNTTIPAQTFGAVRYWDDTTAYSTKWCDLQPTAAADVDANLKAKLDPKLDAAAKAGVKRVVMVLGHPAPWVFGAGSKTGPWWFCGAEVSSVTVPSAAYLGTSKAMGQGWIRFANYVSKVLSHVAAKYPNGMPFELAVETWNEPGAGFLRSDTQIANAATSPAEAVASLATYEQIVRYYMDTTPGLDTAHVKLLVSSLTTPNSAVTTAYIPKANTNQIANKYVHYAGLYDGVSVHTYSLQDGTTRKSADALVTQYETGTLATLMGNLAGQANLKALPVFQTETNHGFATTNATRAFNDPVSGGYTAADRSKLMARLLVDALRWKLAGQFLYAFAGNQYPLHFDPNVNTQVVSTDDAYKTLLEVRGWIVGSLFGGCTQTKAGVWDCAVKRAPYNAVQHIVWSDTAASASFVVPQGASRIRAADGSVQNPSVTPGATTTVTTAPVLFE